MGLIDSAGVAISAAKRAKRCAEASGTDDLFYFTNMLAAYGLANQAFAIAEEVNFREYKHEADRLADSIRDQLVAAYEDKGVEQ